MKAQNTVSLINNKSQCSGDDSLIEAVMIRKKTVAIIWSLGEGGKTFQGHLSYTLRKYFLKKGTSLFAAKSWEHVPPVSLPRFLHR